jgi:hypothetical protein
VSPLLDRHLGPGWEASADPATWQKIDAIPDAELWERALVEEVR